jgi:hypothetical protein
MVVTRPVGQVLTWWQHQFMKLLIAVTGFLVGKASKKRNHCGDLGIIGSKILR